MSGMEPENQITDWLEQATLPKGKGKEAIWESIQAKIDQPDESKTRRLNPIYWVAASIVLLGVIGYLIYPTDNLHTFRTQYADSKIIELPDGSKAHLNADSKLSYTKNWDRTLSLEGEAFFEVTKGETFTVNTPTGSVKVLGTSFNVAARDGNMEVACKTGKVQVDIPKKDFSEVITPGQMITFVNDTTLKSQRKIELIATWKAGEFYFENAELDDVLKEMTRQFNVQFEMKVENKRFSGYFKNNDLNQALKSVCLPLGLTFSTSASGRIIIE